MQHHVPEPPPPPSGGGLILRWTALLAIATITTPTHAELRLASIFGDAMVVQREKPVRVWGWAKAGDKITVSFADRSSETAAGAGGEWTVELEALQASSEERSLIVTAGDERVELTDVLVGEVWICGGQSNMEWTLRSSRDADVEIPSADYPSIRYIRLPHIARHAPQQDFPVENPEGPQGSWRRCTPEQVENCTAVGYYFARRLHRRLGVPVGLVDTSWGGTMAQHWVTKETLRTLPSMQPYFEKYEAARKAWTEGGGKEGARRRYESDVETWEKKRDEAKSRGERPPRKPNRRAYEDPSSKGQPGGMFNGMIAPIRRLMVRGILFYQGENNSFVENWKPFPRTFPAVVADWRRTFADDELPFGIVQIAGWSNRRSMTYDMNHHTNIIREVQFRTWRSTPNTGLIVTFDTNSNGSIHPSRKLPVGERSARWALAEVYGATQWKGSRLLEWRGPVYESMEIDGKRIFIDFDANTSRGLRLDQDEEIGFYIAGEDREFHHARARVARNRVQVWSDDVPKPVAVRYGWSNLPTGGLMNARELPAYPFRTDTWPLVPHQSKGAYDVQER